MALAVALASASIVWLGLLTFAAANQTSPYMLVAALVYKAGALICHQRPERSFTWNGLPWPVCARCLGLYAGAPLGALAALAVKQGRPAASKENFLLLCIAASPTLLTFAAEHVAGWPVGNGVRFAAAVVPGAAVAWLLIRTARESGAGVSQYTLSDARRGESR